MNRNVACRVALCAVLAGMAAPVSGQTTYNGKIINADETWGPSGNPYYINGDIVVSTGATLTIQAGTHIQVSGVDVAPQPPTNGATGVTFVIHGALQVTGTTAAPVSFYSGSPGGAWGGIVILPGASGALIDHASISDAYVGVDTSQSGSGVTIRNSLIYANHSSGGSAAVILRDGNATIDAVETYQVSIGVLVGNTAGGTITNLLAHHVYIGVQIQPTIRTTTNIANATLDNVDIGVYLTGPNGTGSVPSVMDVNVINSVITNVLYNGPNAAIASGAAPGSILTFKNNDIFGLATGTSAFIGVAADPSTLYVDPHYVSATDYRLQPDSLLIDAGLSTAAGAPDHDLLGSARDSGGVDIGAYEFVATVAAPIANAGPNQTFTADNTGNASVSLAGAVSAPPTSVLTYKWAEGTTTLATTTSFTHTFATGVHLLAFSATDQYGQTGSSSMLLGVQTGASGTPGPQGPVGPSGAQGPTGPTGPQGAAGPTGPQGDKGDQGVQGAMGPQGTVGPTGAQGVKGDKGDQGPQGAMGPQGTVGPTGPQGAKGDKGDPGLQGAIGPQGPIGPTGLQGIAGTVPSGTIIFLLEGTPPPAGYTFLFKITEEKALLDEDRAGDRNGDREDRQVRFDVYQKRP